jgi:hypothetical protein
MAPRFRDLDQTVRRAQGFSLILLAPAFAFIGFLLGILIGIPGQFLLLFAAGCGIVGAVIVHFTSQWITNTTATAISRIVLPTGASTPYAHAFSLQDTLVAEGNPGAALELYEAHLTSYPDDIEAHSRAAELYFTTGNGARAAAVFVALRRIRGLAQSRELYATQRLVDVYQSLGDHGRVLVELRRLVERFPSTVEASHARDAIARLKG